MRTQVVLTAPSRILVGRYLTKSIQKRVDAKQISSNEALKRFGKNRYKPNPASKPLRDLVSLQGKGKFKTRILTHLN